jgi:putative RecB family exonuclease
MEERRYTRSLSQLKQYSKCSEAFRLQRMVRPRLPSRPASWLAGGLAFHDATEEYERARFEGETWVPTQLGTRFTELYDWHIDSLKQEQPDLDLWLKPPRSTVEKDITNRLKSGVEKWIPNYLEYTKQPWKIFELPDGSPALEVQFEIKLGEVKVTGSIDRVLEWEDGACSVEDLKTGNREERFDQLGLYAYVLNSLREDFFLDSDIDQGRYFYAKDGQWSDWKPMARYTEKYLTDIYTALDRGIQNRVFLPNPGDCEICAVRPWCRELGWLGEGESYK